MISTPWSNASLYLRLTTAVLLFVFILSSYACAKRSRSDSPANASASISNGSPKRININTASAKELDALPGIGKGFAERIIEHREKYGPFRRVEHLMMVRGISEARFRALRHQITVE